MFKEQGELREDEVKMRVTNLSSAHWGARDDQRTEIEDMFGYEQVEHEAVLQSFISVKLPKKRKLSHIMVFECVPLSSKLYSVFNIADELESQGI